MGTKDLPRRARSMPIADHTIVEKKKEKSHRSKGWHGDAADLRHLSHHHGHLPRNTPPSTVNRTSFFCLTDLLSARDIIAKKKGIRSAGSWGECESESEGQVIKIVQRFGVVLPPGGETHHTISTTTTNTPPPPHHHQPPSPADVYTWPKKKKKSAFFGSGRKVKKGL